jgi:hypothetical protein
MGLIPQPREMPGGDVAWGEPVLTPESSALGGGQLYGYHRNQVNRPREELLNTSFRWLNPGYFADFSPFAILGP